MVLDRLGSVSYWSDLRRPQLPVAGRDRHQRVRKDRRTLGAASEYGRIIRASFFLFGIVAVISYLTRAEIARSYLAIALPLGPVRVTRRQVGLAPAARRVPAHRKSSPVCTGRRGHYQFGVPGEPAPRSAPGAGYRVAGLCLPGGPQAWSDQDKAVADGFPVVGDLTDVIGAIRRCYADMAAREAFGSEETKCCIHGDITMSIEVKQRPLRHDPRRCVRRTWCRF